MQSIHQVSYYPFPEADFGLSTLQHPQIWLKSSLSNLLLTPRSSKKKRTTAFFSEEGKLGPSSPQKKSVFFKYTSISCNNL